MGRSIPAKMEPLHLPLPLSWTANHLHWHSRTGKIMTQSCWTCPLVRWRHRGLYMFHACQHVTSLGLYVDLCLIPLAIICMCVSVPWSLGLTMFRFIYIDVWSPWTLCGVAKMADEWPKGTLVSLYFISHRELVSVRDMFPTTGFSFLSCHSLFMGDEMMFFPPGFMPQGSKQRHQHQHDAHRTPTVAPLKSACSFRDKHQIIALWLTHTLAKKRKLKWDPLASSRSSLFTVLWRT